MVKIAKSAKSTKAEGASSTLKNEIAALKRERIIDAAVDAFYEAGYENTTLDNVAARLGVTKPFIYACFSSKNELLSEICARAIRSSVTAIDDVLAMDVGATERLRILTQRFVKAVLDAQKHVAIFTREEKNLPPDDYARINAMRRDFDRKLTSILDAGIEAGELHMSDARIAALAIGGIVSWSYIWYRPGGRLELDQLAYELSELILSMAGAMPTRP